MATRTPSPSNAAYKSERQTKKRQKTPHISRQVNTNPRSNAHAFAFSSFYRSVVLLISGSNVKGSSESERGSESEGYGGFKTSFTVFSVDGQREHKEKAEIGRAQKPNKARGREVEHERASQRGALLRNDKRKHRLHKKKRAPHIHPYRERERDGSATTRSQFG